MTGLASVEALTFDHYGTLFDKHAVAGIIDEAFPGRGEAIARTWFQTTKEYCWLSGLMERYLTWDDLTRRALLFSVRSLGLDMDDALHAKLIEADLRLPPFPEVPGALERLAARFDLYVLSMASPWMIEESQRNAGLEAYFKKVISAEPHRVYKPGAAAYDLGVTEIGLEKERIGFVSSNSYDVLGGLNYGFPTVWVNRSGAVLDELGLRPDLEVADLAELATALGA